LIERSDLSPRTPRSLTAPGDIKEELDRVRTQGFAIIDQEVELGLRSIAVPLYNAQGAVVAALNTGVSAVQEDAADLKALYLNALRQTQAGLQRVLF